MASQAMEKLTNLLDKVQQCGYSTHSPLLEYLGVQQEKQLITGLGFNIALLRKSLPCHIHDKLFISMPRKKRAEDMLNSVCIS
jgi:hypothetical protein